MQSPFHKMAREHPKTARCPEQFIHAPLGPRPQKHFKRQPISPQRYKNCEAIASLVNSATLHADAV